MAAFVLLADSGGASPRRCGEASLHPYLMWTPEIARPITRRWTSDVPSKIV